MESANPIQNAAFALAAQEEGEQNISLFNLWCISFSFSSDYEAGARQIDGVFWTSKASSKGWNVAAAALSIVSESVCTEAGICWPVTAQFCAVSGGGGKEIHFQKLEMPMWEVCTAHFLYKIKMSYLHNMELFKFHIALFQSKQLSVC